MREVGYGNRYLHLRLNLLFCFFLISVCAIIDVPDNMCNEDFACQGKSDLVIVSHFDLFDSTIVWAVLSG